MELIERKTIMDPIIYSHILSILFQVIAFLYRLAIGKFSGDNLVSQVPYIRVISNFVLLVQVCEDRSCQEEVFPLAMSYVDRFLSTCAISKSQLQLLGTACLLLASKLREPNSRALPADLLVFYTDNSITLNDLHVSCMLFSRHCTVNVLSSSSHSFSDKLSLFLHTAYLFYLA